MMAKVLTIRDPKTGALIAEEQLRPKEDEDSALARVYRKTLGADAPEVGVISTSVWGNGQKWAAGHAKDWASIKLAVLGRKGDPDLENAHLVLASVSERAPVSRMSFPSDKDELDAIKHGRKRDAVVPVRPENPPAVGDTVRFQKAIYDPFGELLVLSDGEFISVELTEVRNENEEWAGHNLYYIAWGPVQPRKSSKQAAARKAN